MSKVATFDLKEIGQRIAAADAEIVGLEDTLEERKASLRESGVTGATISAEDAKLLVDAQKEIDGKKDEAIVLRDLRQGFADVESRGVGLVGNREAQQHVSSYHALMFGTDEYRHLTAERLRGNSPIGAMPAIELVTHAETIRRLEQHGGAGLFRLGPLAAATADLDAGIPLDERLFPAVETLTRQIRLLDLITVGSTTSDTVVYARQTTRTSAAAETALGTAYSEASYDFEQVDASVKDIGHFTTAYRSQIADAGQFDTIVRRQLQEDVLLRLESQLYAGNGAGANLTGLTDAATGIGEVTRDTTNETRIDAIHRAITTVRNNFREPTAVVVHPNDYEDIVFEKDANERHMLLQPGGFPNAAFAPMMTVWGKPLVVTPVATEGTAVLGFWPDATLWVRSGVSLAVSDSHSDYFTKRQVAILAEMRGAFSVTRPAAFCKINLI